jgi:uncharacterized protein (DUF4415 family)
MSVSRRKPKNTSPADWEAVDSPPLKASQLAKFRRVAEARPDIAASYQRSRGRPKSDQPKTLVSLRLDVEIIRAFKAGGPGWRTRINDVLARWAKRHKTAA